jgi:transposase
MTHWSRERMAKAAEAQGVSRTTAHKLRARYRAEGWRASRTAARARRTTRSWAGSLKAAVTVCARSASQVLLDAAVWFASHGVRIEQVLTDNVWAYGHSYDQAVEAIGARHKRTRHHRPQTNGKPERFINTLLHQWAYGQLTARRPSAWTHCKAGSMITTLAGATLPSAA